MRIEVVCGYGPGDQERKVFQCSSQLQLLLFLFGFTIPQYDLACHARFSMEEYKFWNLLDEDFNLKILKSAWIIRNDNEDWSIKSITIDGQDVTDDYL